MQFVLHNLDAPDELLNGQKPGGTTADGSGKKQKHSGDKHDGSPIFPCQNLNESGLCATVGRTSVSSSSIWLGLSFK